MLGALSTAKKVVSTLGKDGRYALVKKPNPFFTLDGVTVANSVELKDGYNVGADLIKSVANKTNKEVGDGTTTTVLLTSTLLVWSYLVSFFVGQKKTRENLKQALQSFKLKHSFGHLENVASTSCRDNTLGKTIAEIIEKTGANTTFNFKESGEGVVFAVNSGTFVPVGAKHPIFLKGKKFQMEDLLVYVSDNTVTSNKTLLPILEKGKPVLFVTKGVSGQALDTLVLNTQKGIIDVCVVDVEDTILYKALGATKDDCLFEAESCVVEKDKTFIKFKDTSNLDNFAEQFEDKELIAQLNGTIVDVYVGAETPQKTKELIHRLEDASNATRNAIVNGVVKGGGYDLARATFYCDSKLVRWAFRRMLTSPYRRLKGGNVYDPYLTQITAVRNAVGVAELFLNTKHII